MTIDAHTSLYEKTIDAWQARRRTRLGLEWKARTDRSVSLTQILSFHSGGCILGRARTAPPDLAFLVTFGYCVAGLRDHQIPD
jgi:hypothetical protein